MSQVEAMVSLERLTRRFGDVTAVDGLSFDVASAELFGLVGPDGSGKTTTLRMLAGVLLPTEGDALMNGTSMARNPESAKPDLAYMSQRFGLYSDLTVRENLHFYADLYEVPRAERDQRMERLFRFSNLGPFTERLAGKLSGGMKQKLGLSCALIHQPKILLLDEPTFGVDPISRRDLWLIVHEMVAEGVTVIVSTAYMDEAERFDRVALLNEGRLLALATPAEMQEELKGKVYAVVVDRLREARDRLQPLHQVERAAVFGDRLHVTLTDPSHAPVIETTLQDGGFSVRGTDRIEPSMEDVFIHHVSQAGVL
ncbi:MAG: ABC transporter ATP-binding protein [Gemmatimonadales bacterium]|nr:ABC transporter ATP-binding protein [Gemmatimonadales bacterium]